MKYRNKGIEESYLSEPIYKQITMKDLHKTKRKKMLRQSQGIESIGDILMSSITIVGVLIVFVAVYLMLKV